MAHLSPGALGALNGKTTFMPGPRGGLDAASAAYVRQCREKGWGWQAIAQQLGVNVISLRTAYGDLARGDPAGEAETPRRKLRDYKPLRAGTQLAAALMASAAGARTQRQVADRIDTVRARIALIETVLINRGLLTTGWRLTPEGVAEAARLEALRDA
ncbi:MAG TPA: hypothetical protein VF474_16470 [Phenylobacterium sp.]